MNLLKFFIKSVRSFLRRFFHDSSTHGFPYVVHHDFHTIERMFWLGMVLFSGFCAFHVFSGQLKRYNENPTVLSIDILSQGEFDRPSFTICTNYSNVARAKELVKGLWMVDSDSPEFQMYLDFVLTVSNTTLMNLGNFQPFANKTDFNEVDFLMIAREMKNIPLTANSFTHVITEMGICQSSTKYFKFQNPYFKSKSEGIGPTTKFETCSLLEVCRTSVSPYDVDPTAVNTIFIHNYEEIMAVDGPDFEVLYGTMIIERVSKIEQIISEPEVKEIKPKSRKCLYDSESQSKYFNVYTINLCKIDCRIKRALKHCRCIPFFYAVPSARVCNVSGMLCLSKTTWYDLTSCECPSLCETIFTTKMSKKEQDLHFDSMLTVDYIFPKTRMKRSVLFDFDDLIVGFGGSVALFLGFSFLTGIEMVYFVIEYLLELIINSMKVRPSAVSSVHISVPAKKKLSTPSQYW